MSFVTGGAYMATKTCVIDDDGRIAFDSLTTEQLREMAAKTGQSGIGWNQWTRDMLLAFHHNRHGKVVPQEIL